MPRHYRYRSPRKTFSQRLGETNVMSDGMLEAVDATDLAILAVAQGAPQDTNEEKKENR